MRRTLSIGLALLATALLLLPTASAHVVYCIGNQDACAKLIMEGPHVVVDLCPSGPCDHARWHGDVADAKAADDRFDRLFGPVEADVPL